MSVRKRVWTTRRGKQRSTWVTDFSVDGKRKLRSFATKEEAEKFWAEHLSVNPPRREISIVLDWLRRADWDDAAAHQAIVALEAVL